MAALVDAEVAGDHRLAVDDLADRETFGQEPLGEVAVERRLDRTGRDALDADEAGDEYLPRRLREPVGREERQQLAREGHLGDALDEERVGDELGMQLPLEKAASERPRVVARPRRRVRGAVAVEEREKVRPVAVTVAVRRVPRLLDREMQRAAGRAQLGEGAGVQLVRESVAVGIVVERELHQGGLPRPVLADPTTVAQPRAAWRFSSIFSR